MPSKGVLAEKLGAWVDLRSWRHGPIPMPSATADTENPRAMYYDIALTLRSKRLLRISIRDLWEEGLVQGTLDNIGKGRGLQMDVITEALRQWCLEGIEPEQIAKSMKLSEAQVRKAIDLGMQVVITSIKPKHIRDEFLKVAMGERLPQFTAEEVAKLRSRRDWHLP